MCARNSAPPSKHSMPRLLCVTGGKWEGRRGEDSTLQKARYFLREKMPEVPFSPVFCALHSLFALPHFFSPAS